MPNFNKLFTMYRSAEALTMDRQVVYQCKAGSFIPIKLALSYFKGESGNRSSNEYLCIKNYLIGLYGKNVINDLEAMQ